MEMTTELCHFHSFLLQPNIRAVVTSVLVRELGLRLLPFNCGFPGQRLIGQNLLISNLGLDNVTHSQ